MDLKPLFDKAFLMDEAINANEALDRARTRFRRAEGEKSFSYEVVVPEEPDAEWLEGTLLRKLVYHCESTRSALPECQGIFVSLFVGDRLYCVPAKDVVAFGCEALDVDVETLVARYGTGELKEAIRPATVLLPGAKEP
ncbi:MAG: hypothetical protein D6729_12140 [Deltaproteobacteria bacterium]|nr:MAG: hypothetical protein D6729_12140 [Deltaproteobacteria bacterium]